MLNISEKEKLYIENVIKKARLMNVVEGNVSDEDLFQLYVKLREEQEEKNKNTDKLIDFNDEIVEIEEMGELETIDITVTGDSLFFCNDILTKNSFGINFTADFILSLTIDEEMEKNSQMLVKQLKSRYGNKSLISSFFVGMDRSRMTLFDLEKPTDGLQHDVPVMDNSKTGERLNEEKSKKDFTGLKF